MNTALIILGIVTSLACVTYIERKRQLYRRLWIEAVDRMHLDRKTASLQRDIASKTAQHWKGIADAQLAVAETHHRKCAKCQQELTRALESLDSLMNGDKQCVNGHRYHIGVSLVITNSATGESSRTEKCPHCGAREQKGSWGDA